MRSRSRARITSSREHECGLDLRVATHLLVAKRETHPSIVA
jgi:hypothetical protein